MQRSEMWGYKNDTGKGVLKKRPNNLCGSLFLSFFRNFPDGVVRNPIFPTFRFPTCRFALRRVEIFCPFGTN
ncbi:hypothetical protein Barb6_00388 [Bacteroidales bacterium Barb6]|nr:hypothetical protein Barb6_00388 [Bacteroidales bacterium Barb6]